MHTHCMWTNKIVIQANNRLDALILINFFCHWYIYVHDYVHYNKCVSMTAFRDELLQQVERQGSASSNIKDTADAGMKLQ